MIATAGAILSPRGWLCFSFNPIGENPMPDDSRYEAALAAVRRMIELGACPGLAVTPMLLSRMVYAVLDAIYEGEMSRAALSFTPPFCGGDSP
jgi:hypothetical protein